MLATNENTLAPDPENDPDDVEQYHAAYDELVSDPEERAKQDREIAEKLGGLGLKYLQEVQTRIASRQQIEQRWLEDLRQYNGQYEPEAMKALEARKYGSRAFVPMTRRICNIVEARWTDLQLPTEDRSFVIAPSPQPELVRALGLAKQLPPDEPVNVQGQKLKANAVASGVRELIDEAKQAANAMQRTVDDNLKEASYTSKARMAMHEALVLGTGVLKGPCVLNRTKRSWVTENGKSRMVEQEDSSPWVDWVSVWNFFPDLTVSDVRESVVNYERHYKGQYDLFKLKGQPGFIDSQIDEILKVAPPSLSDSQLQERRVASGALGVQDNRYTIFERHGVMSLEDLQLCGCADLYDEHGEPLPNLKEYYDACVFFDDKGRIIKAYLNPQATGVHPYSVVNWVRDSASIFGYGLPYDMKDMQIGANSTFRAMQDNTGLIVGPQVVVDTEAIVPQDGNWTIAPLKVWKKTDKTIEARHAFMLVNIESRLNELMALFKLIKELSDEIGGPQLAMAGEDSTKALTNSATGASIAFGQSTVWMKRAVRLYDDQITDTLIPRFVDWNMEYNPDPRIKGDWNVIARGTAGLLAAEGQVQKLMQLMKLSAEAGIPVRKVIMQLREIASGMRLDPDLVLPTVDEAEQLQKDAANRMTPEMARIQIAKAQIEDNERQRQHEDQINIRTLKVRLAEVASKEGITIDEAQKKYTLDIAQMEQAAVESNRDYMLRAREHLDKVQLANTEFVIKQRMGSGI